MATKRKKIFSEKEARTGVQSFYDELFCRAEADSGAAGSPERLHQWTEQQRFTRIVGELADGPFVGALDTLVSLDAEQVALETIQAGGSTGMGRYVIRAFQNRLCGKSKVSEEVRKILEDAEKKGVRLSLPTADGLAIGTASVVAVCIGTAFTGPIAVALAPLIGGIALLIVQCGIDAFCDWATDFG